MNHSPSTALNTGHDFPITVLLVDDQAIIGEGVRQMLASESDITLHFCSDPTEAMEMAKQVRPTVILQDLVMPEIDGLLLVKFYRASSVTKDIPLIVLSSKEEPIIKAQAFGLGANDYLVKLPDKLELIARIRYHSSGYIRLLQRNASYAALDQSRRHMAEEIEAGAKFLYSLLPAPCDEPVQVDWRYIPCTELAGDTLGYHWIDPDHLALYILDVAGHGIASALLSVSILNVLRSRSLPNTDFRKPNEVLGSLNSLFRSEDYGDKFYTIWYGVYCKSSQKLAWSGGGHPDAFLFTPCVAEPAFQLTRLASGGPLMGVMDWDEYTVGECSVPPGSRLYTYTDGAHEIHKPDGTEWSFEEFVAFMSSPPESASLMDRLLWHVRELRGSTLLDDDFSIIEAQF
jgi:sigma-B regulation protein RsbU (phosphoserine phosphatase)